MSKWIEFREVIVSNRKTKIFRIMTIDGGDYLGQISWFARWRKYAFYPVSGSVLETQCLGDICDFINKLMKERKDEKASNID